MQIADQSITDRKVLFELIRNPRLGLGEAYMDERLVVEDGTILDLMELITSSNRWEDGGRGRKLFGKSKLAALKGLWRRNRPERARRNVAHHYDLGNELYETFLDDDLSTAAPISPTPATASACPADKKPTSRQSMAARQGSARPRLGCAARRFTCTPSPGSTCRRHAVESQPNWLESG